jgi:hypothetical protein
MVTRMLRLRLGGSRLSGVQSHIVTAVILILSQLAGPVVALVPSPPVRDASAPGRCCCCPVGACNCGCQGPKAPIDPDEEPRPPRSVVCSCGDVPLGLPGSQEPVGERPAVVYVVPAQVAGAGTPVALTAGSGHWAHGPPSAIPLLATIILLI